MKININIYLPQLPVSIVASATMALWLEASFVKLTMVAFTDPSMERVEGSCTPASEQHVG